MSDVLLTNLFFTITALAIVLFVACLCVAVFYVVKILRDLSRITHRVEMGSALLAEDVDTMRSFVVAGGIGRWLMRVLRKTARRGRTAREDISE